MNKEHVRMKDIFGTFESDYNFEFLSNVAILHSYLIILFITLGSVSHRMLNLLPEN